MTTFKKIAAFSLLEMAISLVVVGTALVVILPTITQHYAGQLASTQKRLLQTSFTEIDQVLVAFAKQHYRLPCPDSGNTGVEDCTVSVGNLPFKTLGYNVAFVDGYQRQIRYSVYKNPANDLNLATSTATAVDRYVPVMPKSAILPVTINDLDFCQAVRLTQTQALDTLYSHGTHSGIQANTAYVLASGGAFDANQNAADGVFDGLNENGGVRFDSTDNVINATYDDYVHVMSFTEFAGRLNCGGIAAGVTSMANLAINAWGQSELANDGVTAADNAVTAAIFNVTMAAVQIVMGGIAVTISVADGLLAVSEATAINPVPAIAVVVEIVAAGIELGAAIAATVQAGIQLADANTAYDGAVSGQTDAEATEAVVIAKALAADWRGGTTK